jgi:hypothetical protein
VVVRLPRVAPGRCYAKKSWGSASMPSPRWSNPSIDRPDNHLCIIGSAISPAYTTLCNPVLSDCDFAPHIRRDDYKHARACSRSLMESASHD